MTTHLCCSRWMRALLLCLIAVLAWPSLRPALAATTAPTETTATVALTPVADSTVDQLNPTANYGQETTLRVERPAGASAVEIAALLRFDLTGLPAGAIITNAELRLYQRSPAPTAWLVDIQRLLQSWDESSVTWQSQPKFGNVYNDLAVPAGENQRVAFDVTTLVQSWFHEPAAQENFGLRIAPGDLTSNRRNFDSSEAAEPPQLVIQYTPLPPSVTIPQVTTAPQVDGFCGRTEYPGAAAFRYSDVDGSLRPLFLLHTAEDLFVCIAGAGFDAPFPDRFFGLYLDTDLSTPEGGNQVPNADDFSLQVTVVNSATTTLQGTGGLNGPYAPDDDNTLGPWEAKAISSGALESAEFRIPLTTLNPASPCGASFGLGVFHQSVRTFGDDAGWPLIDGPARPAGWMPTFLINATCPIRVCVADAACTAPAANALVYRTGDGQAFSVDAQGYVQNRAAITVGDQLWALHPLETQSRFTVFETNGAPQTVNQAAFEGAPPGVMTLVVSDQNPLVLHQLEVAAQWTLTPDERTQLAQQIVKASDFLYDFTDGQFALGNVTVHQAYEAWPAADLWAYANNNLRPKATAGGVVEAELADPNPANDLTYFPGYVHMGRYWNRYQAPEGEAIVFEGQPVDPATLVDDWSIALAHEMSHYALFLFDTYFGVGADDTIVAVDSCTGSAMGWVYEPENWGYVYDPAQWSANCAATHANQLLGRDEWATIRIHYLWLITPSSFVAGPAQPPVPLTQVSFIEPANPGTPLANQLYDLLYTNGENASRKALAYLYRSNLVIGQGNVPKGTTQIALAGAQAGDRFCVYDIDAAPPAPDSPRHQYGCETLADGDNQLQLERTVPWKPIVLVDPVGPTSIAISVTQPLGGNAPLAATVYPEHTPGATTVVLAKNGNIHTGVVDLGAVTPSAYVQVYVDEAASETDPRREAMAMYGVDGGTVPGPSSWNQKAPVYSSDGSAVAWPTEAIRVEAGQWVSMQYMVETFPTPSGSTRLSDAYRVISWPPDLATRIVVAVEFEPLTAPLQAAGNTPNATQQTAPVFVRYWTGSDWKVVATSMVSGQDGNLVASAILPANAVFAVFSGPVRNYLPTLYE